MYKIVVLTAVVGEYEAIRNVLVKESNNRINEDINGAFYYEHILLDSFDCKIIISFTEQGNCEASIHVLDAYNRYKPNLFIYAGTCGGIKDVKIGDSIIATNVFDIMRGSEKEEWKSKPISSGLKAGLKGVCKSVMLEINRGNILNENYFKSNNKVFMGDIGSGSTIVAKKDSIIKQLINKNYANILAIEMEGYGFYKSLEENGDIEGILIRAVTDNATVKNEENDVINQPNGMEKLSFLILEIIKKYLNQKKVRNEKNNVLNNYFDNGKSKSNIMRILNKKDVVFAGFLSFELDFRKNVFLHLGHCYFISLIDELLKNGKEVIIFICSSNTNFYKMNIDKLELYKRVLNDTINRWKKCFENQVTIIDIGEKLRTSINGDANFEEELLCYYSVIEKNFLKLHNDDYYVKLLNDLQNWRHTGKINKENYNILERALNVYASDIDERKIKKDEILAMAYILVKHPSWYSKEWVIQFIQFFIQCYMNNQKKIIIIEANRNAYSWKHMSFICKKFNRRFPDMLFFNNVSNIDGSSYMESSVLDKSINTENIYNLEDMKLSEKFIENVSILFKIRKEEVYLFIFNYLLSCKDRLV